MTESNRGSSKKDSAVAYEFQQTIYGSKAEMHAAIAKFWLSVGGVDSAKRRRAAFVEATDGQLAAEATESLNLDGKHPSSGSLHSEEDSQPLPGFDRYWLAEAFHATRAKQARADAD